MAGAIDQGLRKFHASLNVADLDRSIAFYRVLLGAEPAKVRSDYAKFDLAEPPLVLSLIPGRPGTGGNLNHVGLRVRNAEELVEIQRRLEAAGLHTEREEGVECCYARQTKFWITDPDRALWEIYVFHDDIDDHGSAAPPRVGAARAWRPRRRRRRWRGSTGFATRFPSRIPHDDNTLHEVRLEGSINAAPEADNRAGLLAESLRALRPGAPIYLHGLAGDRPCGSSPQLPGPAAAVQHVPATGDVVDDLVRAGFVEIQIEKLSDTALLRRRRGADARAADRGAQARLPAREGHASRRCIWDRWRRSPTTSATCSVEAWRRRSISTIGRCCRRAPRAPRFLFLKPDESKAERLLRR